MSLKKYNGSVWKKKANEQMTWAKGWVMSRGWAKRLEPIL